MATHDIETSPLVLTDSQGNEVLSFHVRTTAEGTKQAQIKRGVQVVATFGHDETNRDGYVQWFQEYDKPPVSFLLGRPNGTYGDMWGQASVTIGTVEACTRDGDYEQFGVDGVGVKADPAGGLNLVRRMSHRPETHGAMLRLHGKKTDTSVPEEFLRIGQEQNSTSLYPYFGFMGSDNPRWSFYPLSNQYECRVYHSGGQARILIDDQTRYRYEDTNGTVTTLAP